jgi:hypothetical protein
MKAITLLKGLAVGAGLMYILDPQQGRRRQALIRDKAIHMGKVKRQSFDVMKRDFSNRAQGIVQSVRGRIQTDHPDDLLLVQRVRSAMGRFTSHSHAIEVVSNNCEVTLSGPVLANEVQDLIKCVQNVRGVERVYNNLEVHEVAQGVSSLQGGSLRTQNDRLTPAECMVAVGTGAAMVLYGLGKRGPIGWLVGLGGTALISKGFRDTEHRFDSTTQRQGQPALTGQSAGIVRESIDEFGTPTEENAWTDSQGANGG